MRSPAGPEDSQDHQSLPPEPGEGGVDLGDLRLPDRFDFLMDHAREVVTRLRLAGEKTEKNVRERHWKTIPRLI